MLSQTVGEWILSVVTTRDRATSIMGDLVESRVSSIHWWAAIGSNVLHAMTLRIVGTAIVALLAQFILFVIPSVALMYCLRISVLSFQAWHWCSVFSFVGTQVLTGLWIGRANQKQPLFVCLLVVLLDWALGLLKVNTVSVNMAIWSVPLLLGTFAVHRRRGGPLKPIQPTCSRS